MSDALNQNDTNMLTRFKGKADEFMSALTRLNSIQKIPPNLQEEYSDLQSSAGYIKATITTIVSTVDSVTGFFSDFFGFDGVSATKNYINNRPSQLGLIPLVPIAAITGALAIMTKFISDVYLFERKVQEQLRLESTGMPPADAAKIIGKMSDQGLLQQLGSIARPAGFAIGAFFIFKIIKSLA